MTACTKVVDIIARLNAYFSNINVGVALIHGDTNTSNVMLDDDGQFKLIDPRGYFGNLNHIGDAKYDLAKFLYGLSGYSYFNNDTNFIRTKKTIELDYTAHLPINLDDITGDDYVKLQIGVCGFIFFIELII
jgi:thiamine kinase-like enzyme